MRLSDFASLTALGLPAANANPVGRRACFESIRHIALKD